jgi:hypothetical protein
VINCGNTNYGQISVDGPIGGITGLPTPTRNFGGPVRPYDHTPLGNITDGTANTLLFSEIYVLPETAGWGGPYSDAQTALGGQTFSGFHTPNSAVGDCLGRVGQWSNNPEIEAAFRQAGLVWPPNRAGQTRPNCPPAASGVNAPPPNWLIDDNEGTKLQMIIARSRHQGGVNASRCDASARFYADGIDPLVWNALSSAAGDEAVSLPE